MEHTKSKGLLKLLLFIIFIVLLNALSFRYDHWYDLTEKKVHSLSANTIKALNGIREPVQVHCFFQATDDRQAKARYHLKRFQAYSNLVDFQFHNPETAFDLMRKYNLKQYGVVFVSGSNEHQVYQIDESHLVQGLTEVTGQKIESELPPSSAPRTILPTEPPALNFFQISVVLFISVFVVPLAFAALGLLVWWQRR